MKNLISKFNTNVSIILNEFDVVENEKIVVIFPGRFQPFHKGHKKVLDDLSLKFPSGDIFAVSSNKTNEKSPLSFEEKKICALSAGFDIERFKQVVSPYISSEVVDLYNKKNTKLIFAISKKDKDRISFKKSSYLQPFIALDKCKTADKNGYVLTVPVKKFYVLDKVINSATAIREMYKEMDDDQRKQLIISLYGSMDQKVKEIFDTRFS